MTPEQIASTYKGGVRVLRRLQAHGLHVFTDAELRARDERIVRATVRYLQQYDVNGDDLQMLYDCEVSDIIAAAEDDQ